MKKLYLGVAAATAFVSSVAFADTNFVEHPTWSSTLPVVFQGISGSKFVKDSKTVQGRAPRSTGGYDYLPLCKVTATGDIAIAAPYIEAAKIKFKCNGSGGQVITNPGNFTTETKQMVTQRGFVSPWSLSYTQGSSERLICLGKVGNQEVPGWAAVPAAGQVPTGCNVRVMGSVVAVPEYSLFRHKTGSLVPALPASGNGWWTRHANGKQAVQPLYQLKRADGRTLCRAEVSGKTIVGALKLVSTGTASTHHYQCEVSNNGMVSSPTQYQLYIAAHHATSAANPN